MEELIQQVLGGIATGAIYACIALSVVMIYQAIDHFNFAQGEMAMFSAFICWQMIDWGANYWVAFFVCIVISFMGGIAIERIVFAPLHNAPVFTHIVVFIALFQIFNAVGRTERYFGPEPCRPCIFVGDGPSCDFGNIGRN